MRFGVSVFSAESAAEWRDKARRAESVGFDTLHLSDHLVPTLSPFTAAAVAAEATERLRVGTLVLNNDFRHPVLVAREAATLGLLSNGRFELGLGAGHMRSEYDEVGLPFDPAAVRVARLAEAVPIIRDLLDGEEVSVEGDHYRIDGHRGFPELAAGQRVPMLVGGNGRRVLRIAAEQSDVVGLVGFVHRPGADSGIEFTNFTAAGLDDHVAWVRRCAGDRFADLELNALVQAVIITERRRVAAEKVADRLGGALTVEEVLESPFLLIGTPDQMAEDLRARQERFGIGYWTVFAQIEGSDQQLATLAPVIERLT